MSGITNDITPKSYKFSVAEIASSLLLILFLYTGLNKLFDNTTFALVLLQSPLLHPVAGIISVTIPVAELAIAVILFLPDTRLIGFYSSFLITTLFTFYLIYMVSLYPALPCSCGGVLKALTWKQHIFFNSFFVLLSVLGIIMYNRSLNRRSSRPP